MKYSIALGLLPPRAPWVKHPVITPNLTSECWNQAESPGCSPGAQLLSDTQRVKLISLWTMTRRRLNLTVPSARSDWTYGRCVWGAPERVSPRCPLDERCVADAEDQIGCRLENLASSQGSLFSPPEIICNEITVIVSILYFTGSVFSADEYQRFLLGCDPNGELTYGLPLKKQLQAGPYYWPGLAVGGVK